MRQKEEEFKKGEIAIRKEDIKKMKNKKWARVYDEDDEDDDN